MRKLSDKYNIEALIEVVEDRLADYEEIKEEYEESYAGEQEIDADKYYSYGYGNRLEEVLLLLEDIRNSVD